MERKTVRLELLKLVVPQATRVGLSEPQQIIDSCAQLEKYVLDFDEGEKLPNSPTRRTLTRPKRTTDDSTPGNLNPTHGG